MYSLVIQLLIKTLLVSYLLGWKTSFHKKPLFTKNISGVIDPANDVATTPGCTFPESGSARSDTALEVAMPLEQRASVFARIEASMQTREKCFLSMQPVSATRESRTDAKR